MEITYSPIMVCNHGKSGNVTFHSSAKEAHNSEWHSPEFPMSCRIATKEEHMSAGWNVSNYPKSISC